MNRYCFSLQVAPDRLGEYVERHRRVWPSMLRALDEAGWSNYSLFLREDGLLIGYVECPDLAAAQAAMAATQVNRRWQSEMSQFFVGANGTSSGRPDESFTLLREVFNLTSALAALDEPGNQPDDGTNDGTDGERDGERDTETEDADTERGTGG
jgi:L-rhamnose mutarotase